MTRAESKARDAFEKTEKVYRKQVSKSMAGNKVTISIGKLFQAIISASITVH